MNAILEFDWAVLQFVEKLWNPVMDVIMRVITLSGDSGIIWVVLGLILAVTKKYRKFGAVILISLLFSLLINDLLLKNLVARPRPYDFTLWPQEFHWPELIKKEKNFSFPSGHTSSSFAAATAIWFTKKKRLIIPATVWASLIAFSRVYVHVHYATDVLGGIAVGILYGILGFFTVELALKLRENYRAETKIRT